LTREVVRLSHGERGRTRSNPCHEPTRQRRWPRRNSSSWRCLPTCWGATTNTSALSSVRITPTSTPATPRGPCIACTGSDTTSRCAERWAPASGWFGRGQRLLEREERDCAERGYLLIPVVVRHAIAGDHGAAYRAAAQIAEIGTRFADRDLIAIGVHEQGHALVRQGRFEEGLRLLDEVMVAVTAGELSPIVTGLVYATRSGSGRACTSYAAPASGPRHWAVGASSSPTWSPTPVSAWCIEPRSCNCRAPGTQPSRRRGAPVSVSRRAYSMNGSVGRPTTGREKSTGSEASGARPRRRTGRRVGADTSPSRAWHCCVLRKGKTTTPPQRSAACSTSARSHARVPRCFPPTSR
jgi:hypothetical protein